MSVLPFRFSCEGTLDKRFKESNQKIEASFIAETIFPSA